ncbi:hypothetical protein QBC44DRAFT_386224 [Cladorrhinum sp. PSN332]|nr:hypothetical protein QBC44DRAFT_386224 [Cladorrhinum sp. PSN332]
MHLIPPTSMAPAKLPFKAFLSLSWLLGLASTQEITTAAPNFRGFRLFPNGATELVTCDPGFTFFTSSTYAACCSVAGRCNFITACESGTYSRIFGGDGVCGSTFPSCMSITIYPTFPAGDQTWLQVACGLGNTVVAPYSTLYRQTPAATTTSSQSLSTASPTPSTSPTTANGPANTSPAASITDKTLEDESSSSKAWIAGAVVGPLFAIALIGLAVFLIRRRQKGNAHGGNGEISGGISQPYMAPPAGYQEAPGPPHQYYGGAMQTAADWQKTGVPPRADTVSPLSGLPSYPGYHDPKYGNASHVTEVSMTPSTVSYPAELAVYPAAGPYVAELENNQRASMAELPSAGVQGDSRRQ